MSFQFIINNATNMIVTSRPSVAQTVSRSGIVKSVSRGNALWRFEVNLTEGAPWEEYRSAISTVESQDRFTVENINFSNSGFDWMFPYLGDEPNIANVRLNVLDITASSLGVATGVTITSGYLFRAGDMIQLSGGRIYRVVEDVAWNQTTVPIHRPIYDDTVGTYDILTGNSVGLDVICISLPSWSFTSRNQVGFSGSFIFQEA